MAPPGSGDDRTALLRDVLEVALAVARQGEASEVPAPLRPYLRMRHRVPRALVAADRAGDDDAFRAKVALAFGDDDLTPAQSLWLTRPDGWEGDLAALVAERRTEREEHDARRLLERERRARAAAEADRDRARARAAEAEAAREESRDAAAAARRAADGAERRAQAAEAERAGAVASLKELEAAHARAHEELRRLRSAVAGAGAGSGTAGPAAGQGAGTGPGDRPGDPHDEASARPGEPVEPVEAPVDPAGPPADPGASAPGAEPGAQGWDRAALHAAVRASSRAAADLADALAAVAAAVDRGPGDAGEVRPDPGGGAPAPPTTDRPRTDDRRERAPRRRPAPLPGGVHDDSPEAADHLVGLPRAVLLVDGYNASMAAWPDADIEDQRLRLGAALERLAARRGPEVVVVFDGTDEGSHRPPGRSRRVRVEFTPVGVEADDVILRRVAEVPEDRPVVVVSDDRAVRAGARARGANVLGTAQLRSVTRVGP